MLTIKEKITNIENMYWAWQKLTRFLKQDGKWYSITEYIGFESNLLNEFDSIINDINNNTYKLKKLIPYAIPKKRDEDGNIRIRQFFWVSIRDQLTWIAVVNVIGQELDYKMPSWSYGNRLFRSVWYDYKDEKKIFNIGKYRHSSGLIYKNFQHSWPLYRRHLYLTIRNLTGTLDLKQEDDKNQDLIKQQKFLQSKDKLKYLSPIYKNKFKKIYWCSIDLTKFYPKTNKDVIKDNFKEYLTNFLNINYLLDALLDFKIDLSNLTKSEADDLDLADFNGLPTGLAVAGFLSNVLMLKIDNDIDNNSKDVIHFRYVDDHIVFTDSYLKLDQWISTYNEKIYNFKIGTNIKIEKTEPEAYKKILVARAEKKEITKKMIEKASDETYLNPDYPVPIMTKITNMVSTIFKTEFDLLDTLQKEHLFEDLEHLLLTDFPEHELKKYTRISFAAGRLAKLAEFRTINKHKYYHLLKDINKKKNRLDKATIKKRNNITELSNDLLVSQQNKDFEIQQINNIKLGRNKRTFNLLCKAIDEHSENLNLWKSTIKFILNTGYVEGITILSEKISKLSTTPLIIKYIQSNFNFILLNCLVNSIRNIQDDTRNTNNQLINYKKFVNFILNNDIVSFDDNFFISKDFSDVFKNTIKLASAQMNNRTLNITDINIFDNNFSIWLWWITNTIPKCYGETSKSLISETIFENISPKYFLNWQLVQKYPRNFPYVFWDYLLTNPKLENVLIKNEGLKLEIQKYSNRIDNPVAIQSVKHRISLDEWINYCNYHIKPNNPSDLRLSEWFSLSIVLKIVEHIRNPLIYDNIQNKICLENFLILSEWVKNDHEHYTLERWKNAFKRWDKNFIKPINNLIIDERYNDLNLDYSDVNALGIILLFLLTSSNKFPAIWNVHSSQKNFMFLAKILLKHSSCSSMTRMIIDACLSNRSRESNLKFMDSEEFEFVEDDKFDAITILDLSNFEKALKTSIKNLEKHIQQNQYMIPVNLQRIAKNEYEREIYAE